MIEFNVFPNGKKRVLTFSYDDGPSEDKRLAELFNKYKVKGTFHLIGSKYISYKEEQLSELKKIYKGHEISSHTLYHGRLDLMPPASAANEIMNDRKILEKIAEYPVIGMSYPYGTYSDLACDVMKSCGMVYSRTTRNTFNFDLPADFLKWHPTCHHHDAERMVEKFLEAIDYEWFSPLLYIWGHSFEFRSEADWDFIENKVIKPLAFNDKIWYATNIEIYNYINALKLLRISADETRFYNPSDIDLWVTRNKKELIHIPAGKTVAA